MQFRDYRKRMGWSLAEAAKFLGLGDGSLVSKHERGVWMPNYEALAAYEKLTNGEVTAQDFIAARRKFKIDNPKKPKVAA